MSRHEAIARRIHDALGPVEGICSITLVGSFADGEDLSRIGDIDTVVVFDKLTPSRFADAVSAVAALSGQALGLPDRQVRVNTTLGPLKCGGRDEIVVHLMFYDRASHRRHVLRSPFTCFDWERSLLCRGQRLADLYPVGCLAPADFFTARRGLADYIADLQSGTISVRRFEPRADAMVETLDRVRLDRKRQGEFAYHIVRHLVVNLLKIRTGRNQMWDEATLHRHWLDLPELADWLPFYERIRAVKIARRDDFPPDTLLSTREFIEAFQASLARTLDRGFRLRLVRHARTRLNDGTFLGSRRDPALADPAAVQPYAEHFDAVFASPLRRAVESASALAPHVPIHLDARLAEIDYGAAEGLTSTELRQRYPATVEAWQRGEDAAFPGGEATQDVLRRVRAFLASLGQASGRALGVTHNVVMRVVAADLLGLDVCHAYRIPIEHLESLDICRIGERWLADWDTTVKARLIDGFLGWVER
jgi:ribonuclease H / adenosylcobalamin/alpha-ribazole phosphatase